MRRHLANFVQSAGLIALAAAGATLGAAPAGKTALDEFLACRATSVDATRLSCFDAAGAKLAEAQKKKDIFVVDREQIRETKRRLFGFSLPNLEVLGDRSEPLATLEATLTSAQPGGDGAMTFVLDNGSHWHQQDDATLGFRLKPGGKVVVRRGALGAYYLSVDGHPSVRVQRVN